MRWCIQQKIAVWFFWWRRTARAAVTFQSDISQHGYVAREHYLGCLWNFRTAITLCPSGHDNAWRRSNRYANITSRKALNSLEDQVLTGVQCFQAWILAHDLQEKLLAFYEGVPQRTLSPPIEEVLWITSLAGEEEQQEIVEICPGMFITSLFLHSEFRFTLNPHDLLGQRYRDRALQILRHLKTKNGTFEADHYRVMMRTWPVSAANAQSLKVRRTIQKLGYAAKERVDVIIVACKRDLTWVDVLPVTSNMQILIYVKCKEAQSSPVCQRAKCIPSWHLDREDSAQGAVQSDECGGYLYHILRQYSELAEWSVFLQDDAPRHLHLGYLNLVLKMILAGTLSASARRPFVHLNNDRHLMYWTPCLASIAELLGLPANKMFASYCCSQFVVHKDRIRERTLAFYQAAQDLLTGTVESLEGCVHAPNSHSLPSVPSTRQRSFQIRFCHLYAARQHLQGSPSLHYVIVLCSFRFVQAFAVAFKPACSQTVILSKDQAAEEFLWHVIFGEDPILPRREDDANLPSLLRFTVDDATLLPLPDFSMLLYAHSPR